LPSTISFGQFSAPLEIHDISEPFKPKFAGKLFWVNCQANFEFLEFWLARMLDLRQADYDDIAIKQALNFSSLPDADLALSILKRFPNVRNDITAIETSSLQQPRPMGPFEMLKEMSMFGPFSCCFRCLELGHSRRNCHNDIKCLGCYGLGHKVKSRTIIPLCKFCKVLGHKFDVCPKIRCNKCNVLGHIASYCLTKKVWVKRGQFSRLIVIYLWMFWLLSLVKFFPWLALLNRLLLLL
jgi:hypothetical protein